MVCLAWGLFLGSHALPASLTACLSGQHTLLLAALPALVPSFLCCCRARYDVSGTIHDHLLHWKVDLDVAGTANSIRIDNVVQEERRDDDG